MMKKFIFRSVMMQGFNNIYSKPSCAFCILSDQKAVICITITQGAFRIDQIFCKEACALFSSNFSHVLQNGDMRQNRKGRKGGKNCAFPAFSDQKRMPMPVTNW